MDISQREEEFIEMVVTTSSKLNLSLQNREFEFQMSTHSVEKEEVTLSPADELFYKGKLLPLHLPPRLQMVQNLIQNSISSPTLQMKENQTEEEEEEEEEEKEECGAHIVNTSLKPWSKKIKLIKQSALSQKLKSSRAYMKSLLTRPTCRVEEAWNVSRAKEYVNKYIKLVKKNPFESSYMESIIDSEINDDDQISFTCHRMSFSGVLKRHSTSKHSSSSTTTTSSSTSSSNCSCSSSSLLLKSTNGFYEINLNSEAENSIEGAIAHCKKSQQKDWSEMKRPQSEVQTCGGDSERSDISRQ